MAQLVNYTASSGTPCNCDCGCPSAPYIQVTISGTVPCPPRTLAVGSVYPGTANEIVSVTAPTLNLSLDGTYLLAAQGSGGWSSDNIGSYSVTFPTYVIEPEDPTTVPPAYPGGSGTFSIAVGCANGKWVVGISANGEEPEVGLGGDGFESDPTNGLFLTNTIQSCEQLFSTFTNESWGFYGGTVTISIPND